jgi:hypothetical protein
MEHLDGKAGPEGASTEVCRHRVDGETDQRAGLTDVERAVEAPWPLSRRGLRREPGDDRFHVSEGTRLHQQ